MILKNDSMFLLSFFYSNLSFYPLKLRIFLKLTVASKIVFIILIVTNIFIFNFAILMAFEKGE